jgi:PAS domain S-box-containing protein
MDTGLIPWSPLVSQGLGEARILVTDDRPEMLLSIDHALGDTYECEFANGLAEAHGKLADGDFQLAICSLGADPEADLGLAEEITRNHPGTATVVLMTGGDNPEAARRAFRLGVYGYLVEPFGPGQLLIAVMSALRRRELELAGARHAQNEDDRHQKIIDMAPVGIYAKDRSGTYVVANSKADELSGLEPGGLIGKTDSALLSPDELDVGSASDRRVFAEGVSHEREDSVEISGVTKTFKTIRFPLRDEAGKVTAAGGMSVEITAELAAAKLRDELWVTQQKSIDELRLSRQETILGLVRAIELHDFPTGEHVERMAAIAALIGAEIGFDPESIQLLRVGATMHDVGKIGVPSEILRKAGPLTAEERAEMQCHTVVGHSIFADFESSLSRVAANIALTHHERYDGSGYPHGLDGDEIPLEGRITAVADVFDALLSDRAYRPAMSVEEAVTLMKEGSGSQFDPGIVKILLDNLDEVLSLRETSLQETNGQS